jgi:hypothetical protein
VKIAERDFRRVLAALKKHGVLLETDAQLPSVASLLAGEPIRGSWWSHRRAQDIFIGLNQLADHEDVLFTKLISRKVTLVHRNLWPDFLSVACAREPWQVQQLSPATKFLLRIIDAEGSARSDKLDWPKRFQAVKIGNVARELEYNLLVHGEEFHTESGAHAKQVERWQHWANRIDFEVELSKPKESKHVLEMVLLKLNDAYGAKGKLPWERSPNVP